MQSKGDRTAECERWKAASHISRGNKTDEVNEPVPAAGETHLSHFEAL